MSPNAVLEIPPRPAMYRTEIEGFLESRKAWVTGLLEEIVNIPGGSDRAEQVDRVGHLLAPVLMDMGFALTRIAAPPYGGHLHFTNRAAGKRIYLVGHMDTTFGDYSGLPAFTIDGDRAIGPGTADMKGGLLVILFALESLHHLGLLEGIPLSVMFNSDEERGSPTSSNIFEEAAGNAAFALVMECGGPGGEVVTARRGKLSYRLRFTGRSEHAAGKELKKRSALLEMAHKLLAVEALDNTREGLSANVGKAWGGIASNTVAEKAELLCDFRFLGDEDRRIIEKEMTRIVSPEGTHCPGVATSLEITSSRPPWEPGNDNRDLFHLVRDKARQLGLTVGEEYRYGTSDANFFAGAGVPTIDGLGPVGFFDHSADEYILLPTLFERILLTALVIEELGRSLKTPKS